jgi:phospholipase/lecithinase/hemolysin
VTLPSKISSLARMFVPGVLRVLAILTCLAAGPIAARAANERYDAIYVFGDSYSDVGNIYAFTKGELPPSLPLGPGPYFNGRFSNGPLWVEHLAGDRGLPLYPSSDTVHNGTDYAWGGAFVTVPGNNTTIPPSIPQQVELYLANTGGHADPNALYIITGGGNDILGASGVSPESLGWQIARGIADSELALRRAGARNFLVPELFNVGLLPAAAALGPEAVSFATEASLATNRELERLLGYEAFLRDVRIYIIHGYSLFQDLAVDSAPAAYSTPTTPVPGKTSHFGFTNIATPCLSPTLAVCSDPDHTLFWDAEHFTEFGHALLALAAESTLNGEPETFEHR